MLYAAVHNVWPKKNGEMTEICRGQKFFYICSSSVTAIVTVTSVYRGSKSEDCKHMARRTATLCCKDGTTKSCGAWGKNGRPWAVKNQ